MTLATAIAAETGTSKEIYDILKARTVPVLGVLPGANLQAVLIGAGLMPYVHDTAGNQALLIRFSVVSALAWCSVSGRTGRLILLMPKTWR